MSLPSREFISRVDDKIGLIIWISIQNLSVQTPGFKECDYLCDGLVSEYLKSNDNQNIEQNVFHTNHFGKDLFIAFNKNSKSILSNLDDVIGLHSESSGKASNKILILSKEANFELLEELQKRYPNYLFDFYTFE